MHSGSLYIVDFTGQGRHCLIPLLYTRHLAAKSSSVLRLSISIYSTPLTIPFPTVYNPSPNFTTPSLSSSSPSVFLEQGPVILQIIIELILSLKP